RIPGGERLDLLRANGLPIFAAQQVLEQDLEGEREPRDVVLRLKRLEPEDLVAALADRERSPRAEAVHDFHSTTTPAASPELRGATRLGCVTSGASSRG